MSHPLLAAAILLAAPPVRAQAPRESPAASGQDAPGGAPRRCVSLDPANIRFDDGDTIFYPFSAEDGIASRDGRPYAGDIRLLGFDTPETLHPEHGIFYPQPSGPEAAALTRKLTSEARAIRLCTVGEPDRYGRLLGHLLLDDALLGERQVEAGLAYETISAFGDSGFPEFARRISEAWGRSPLRAALAAGRKPPFINPYLWRKRNQDKDNAIPRERWERMSEEEKAAVVRRAMERARKRERPR